MPPPGHSDPAVADLVSLSAALERDQKLAQDERTQRDRAMLANLAPGDPDNVALAMRWLDQVANLDPELDQLRENTREANIWANVFVLAVGLVLGWAAAAGVFYFDGNARVNVIAILAAFVLLPGILLVPFLLAAAPRRVLAWIPGGLAVGGLARGLSPGKLGLLVNRLLPRSHGDTFRNFFHKWQRHERLFASLEKWCVLRWSQLLGLGFQIAAVTAALFLVVFSDLAFGWSTTLTSGEDDVDAQQVHSIASSIATPWSWAWNNAEPSPDLVRNSRYFRVTPTAVTREEAAALGGWWPFVIMSMLVYGFLPRLVTLSWASRQQRSATRLAFSSMPDLSSVLRRLRHQHIQTTAPEPECTENSPAVRAEALTRNKIGSGVPGVIINWAQAPMNDEVASREFGDIPVHHAGGSSTIEADENLIDAIGSDPRSDSPILVLVKSWEPPIAEFTDFLTAVRTRIGDGRTIIVLPVGAAANDRLEATEEKHVEVWRRCLARTSDPWLRIANRMEDVA